jgi:hypothetical protein
MAKIPEIKKNDDAAATEGAAPPAETLMAAPAPSGVIEEPAAEKLPPEEQKIPAVIPPKVTAVAVYDPQSDDDLLLEDAGGGMEDIGAKDRQIPFLRIVESLSKERDKTETAFISGAEEGDLFNTVSRQLFKQADGVIAIVVTYQNRWTEWWPRDANNGKKGLVKDWGNDERGAMAETSKDDKNNDRKPSGTEIVKSADYVIMLVNPKTGEFEPIVVSMAKTRAKKARQWNTRLTTIRATVKGRSITPPLWYSAWLLSSLGEKNERGKWHTWDMKAHGLVMELPNGRSIYEACRDLRKALDSGDVKVGVDAEAVGTAPSRPNPDAAGNDGDDDLPF